MRTTERAVFIAGLAWAAGVVDAAGFLLLGGVFTSHMTGNTAGAMLVFITGRGSHGLDRAIVVAAFAAGALGGAVLIERHREHSAAGALWLEAGLLLCATVVTWLNRRGPVVLGCELAGVSAAMGVQNIALAGSALSAHTTHITGPLTDLAGTIARRLVGRRRLRRDESHGLLIYGGRVLAFTLGVASGAALAAEFGPPAFLAPTLVVFLSGVVLWRTPEHGHEDVARPVKYGGT